MKKVTIGWMSTNLDTGKKTTVKPFLNGVRVVQYCQLDSVGKNRSSI